MSILAVLTTAAAFGVEASQTFEGPRRAYAAPLSSVPPDVRDEPVGPAAEVAPPSTVAIAAPAVQTFPTASTMPDLTFDDIELMRGPRQEVLEFQGIVMSFSFGGSFDAPPATREACIREAKTSPLMVESVYDRNLIAQMTHEVFSCLTRIAGLDEQPPTALRRWNGANIWGFESLSDQVASEAVVVAYCESEGFSPRAITGSNAFGYAGLFQMGRTEMARFGESGSNRFDPVDNAVAAANYFLFQYRNRAGWGGWSPWAVVNTNFDDDVNNQVKVPVLPRFVSTDPDFSGRPGPELPAWAADPFSWHVPHWNGTGCPYNGGRWPAAAPVAEVP